ncbi:YncE family protein [Paraburkholderia sp. RL17-337-BIB-A]|uniref:YncE family protein n=1 Tax=Paraburkholderia sp. RL17-337-BIB-A TaxID=3031636 RepID=UPI0038B6FBBD
MNVLPTLLRLFSACLTIFPLIATASPAPLTWLKTIPLPAVTGGDFDHFAVDLPHRRLYVSAEEYGSIEVFSLPDGEHLSSKRAVAKSPHKILLTNDGKTMFIADAGDANVKIVDTSNFQVEKTVSLEPQPDSGVADRKNGILYVGNGGVQSHQDDAYITLLSLSDGAVLGKVHVPAAQLKGMVIDHASSRLFVNLRDKNQVGVIDLKARKLVGVWTVPGPSRNSAMAFDSEHKRLFIGSRAPGKLYVLDSDTGSVVQSLNIVDVSDDMHFDANHHRLYVTGAGGLDVVQQTDPDHYRIEQHIDTLGGKTSAYIPSLHRLYVVHTKGPQATEAGLQVFRVN